MHLYLMRHAEAEKVGEESKTDSERALTAYGRLQAATIADELKRRKIAPLVVSSPLRRAAQTAEILCEMLAIGPFRTEPMLTSTGHAPDLAALLRAYAGHESLLFLGHQPDIGMLVEQVLGFELGFGTATIAAFESKPPASWRFLWTHRPEDLLTGKIV
jgi:phosphohistidine phosphatase